MCRIPGPSVCPPANPLNAQRFLTQAQNIAPQNLEVAGTAARKWFTPSQLKVLCLGSSALALGAVVLAAKSYLGNREPSGVRANTAPPLPDSVVEPPTTATIKTTPGHQK